MPDGETEASLTAGSANPSEAGLHDPKPVLAIEQREARRQARPLMTDEQLERWIELANERYEKLGLAGEDYLPI